MNARLPFTAVVAALFWLVPVATAYAGSEAVLADWRADGRIDATYRLSDLRAADGQVSADEREYYNWDESLAIAMRRATTAAAKRPSSARTPGAGGVDSPGAGTGGEAQPGDPGQGSAQGNPAPGTDAAAGRDDGEDAAGVGPEAASTGVPPALIAVALLIVLVGVVGGVRVLRARRAAVPREDGEL